MTEDKIISFKSRKSLAETEREEVETQARIEEATKVTDAEGVAAQLEAIDKLRHLVEIGKVENLVLIGGVKDHPMHFFSDVAFGADGISANEATLWVGKLEMMKLELTELAFDAAEMNPDGELIMPIMREEDLYE